MWLLAQLWRIEMHLEFLYIPCHIPGQCCYQVSYLQNAPSSWKRKVHEFDETSIWLAFSFFSQRIGFLKSSLWLMNNYTTHAHEFLPLINALHKVDNCLNLSDDPDPVVSHVEAHYIWDRWPCCGHFQLHKQSWLLEGIGHCLIQLTNASCKHCHFKFQYELGCKTHKRSKWSCMPSWLC